MKRTLATLMSLIIVICTFAACGNVAESEPAAATTQSASVTTTTAEPEVATTEPVTTPKATEVTTTSEAVISVDFTTPEVTAPPETVITTTTATTTVTTTTAKQTTTTKKTTTAKKKTTTTAKKTTTTPKQTTTAPKKTTTAKKEDDSKWKLTGVLASYDRLYRGCPTDEDLIIVRDDINKYLYDKYNGKSGILTFCYYGNDAEVIKHLFDKDISVAEETVDIGDAELKLTIDTSLDEDDLWEDCSIRGCDYTVPDAEITYWNARMFRSLCYGTAENGLWTNLSLRCHAYDCELDKVVPIEVHGTMSLDYNMYITNSFTGVKTDSYIIWFADR